MTDQLRTLLEEMTKSLDIDSHPSQLEEIRSNIPHTIRILPGPSGEDLGDFNCVMFALDLVGCLDHPCSPLGRYYADTAFLFSLIDESGTAQCEEKAGALVVWSLANSIKHVCVIVGPGRAASKWGIGYVYEHELLDVPKSYGDAIKIYEPIDSQTVINRPKRLFTRRN